MGMGRWFRRRVPPNCPLIARGPNEAPFTHTNAEVGIYPLTSAFAAWSGRRESNPRPQLGKLMFYH